MAYGGSDQQNAIFSKLKESQENTNKTENKNSVIVNGNTYTIRKLPHLEVFDLLPLVGKLLVVPVMYGISESPEEEFEELTVTDRLPDMVSILFNNLLEAPVKELVVKLLSCVKNPKGDPLDLNKLDDEFEDAVDILNILAKVLEVHFLPFITRASQSNVLPTLAMVTNLKKSLG